MNNLNKKEILVMKIKAFGTKTHPNFLKGSRALNCVCSADEFGSVHNSLALQYVEEFFNEIKQGVITDKQLITTLEKWFKQ